MRNRKKNVQRITERTRVLQSRELLVSYRNLVLFVISKAVHDSRAFIVSHRSTGFLKKDSNWVRFDIIFSSTTFWYSFARILFKRQLDDPCSVHIIRNSHVSLRFIPVRLVQFVELSFSALFCPLSISSFDVSFHVSYTLIRDCRFQAFRALFRTWLKQGITGHSASRQLFTLP